MKYIYIYIYIYIYEFFYEKVKPLNLIFELKNDVSLACLTLIWYNI